jgi:large subunit ribosomal protein L17
MRHQKKSVKLDRKAQARKALLRNLAASVIVYEKITTTEAKAKAVKPLVEKLITLGKENNLTNYRRLLKFLPTKKATKKVVEVLGPKYKERKGGYLRVVKIGRRAGDGAKLAIIEFV